jgi:hypothetical protein
MIIFLQPLIELIIYTVVNNNKYSPLFKLVSGELLVSPNVSYNTSHNLPSLYEDKTISP